MENCKKMFNKCKTETIKICEARTQINYVAYYVLQSNYSRLVEQVEKTIGLKEARKKEKIKSIERHKEEMLNALCFLADLKCDSKQAIKYLEKIGYVKEEDDDETDITIIPKTSRHSVIMKKHHHLTQQQVDKLVKDYRRRKRLRKKKRKEESNKTAFQLLPTKSLNFDIYGQSTQLDMHLNARLCAVSHDVEVDNGFDYLMYYDQSHNL